MALNGSNSNTTLPGLVRFRRRNHGPALVHLICDPTWLWSLSTQLSTEDLAGDLSGYHRQPLIYIYTHYKYTLYITIINYFLRVIPTLKHYFDIVSDILSGIFWHILWQSIWHSILHLFWHTFGMYSDIPSAILSEILSGVRQCPLRPGARSWGPALPTAILSSRLRSGSATETWRLQLGSGSAYWDLELGEKTRGGGSNFDI